MSQSNRDDNWEERLRRLEESEREIKTLSLQRDLERLEREVEHIKEKMVHRDEFNPIQKVVYAAVGFIITATLGTLYNFITKSGGMFH